MVKRFVGGIISSVPPTINNSQASGMFSGATALQQTEVCCWPGTPAPISSPVTYCLSYLIAAGGGSGGSSPSAVNSGGGGGAGGVLIGNIPMTPGCCYVVCVGGGGAGGAGAPCYYGTSGTNSTFGGPTGIVACGGGRGLSIAAKDAVGGSGGGTGGAITQGQTCPNQAGICGQGHRGHGGGGGAGGPSDDGGYNPTTYSFWQQGGPGIASPISGTPTYYGGGGGAGSTGNPTPTCGGPGGIGGGGAGASYGTGNPANPTNTGCSGSPNTGGGGGGSNSGVSPNPTGSGGSGIVIVSYTAPASIGTGGTITCYSCTCNGVTCCYWVHTYLTSGCYCS